jgi:hypothetical protein
MSRWHTHDTRNHDSNSMIVTINPSKINNIKNSDDVMMMIVIKSMTGNNGTISKTREAQYSWRIIESKKY